MHTFMQKIRGAFYALGASILVLPAMASAQLNLGAVGDSSKLEDTPISQVITTLMEWLLYLVGFLGVIAFVISGILYLTAAGDDDKIDKAKTTMIYGIVGVIVALMGLIIINAVNTWLGGGSNPTF